MFAFGLIVGVLFAAIIGALLLSFVTWWYGPTTIAALRLRVKKKDEITADHIAAMVEAGQVGLQFVGGQAVRQANLGEDNDPDLEINPIAVAKIQMEKDNDSRAGKIGYSEQLMRLWQQ